MTDKVKELNLEERIFLYEKIENSLKEFFKATNYCNENCFSKEDIKREKGDCCNLPGKKLYDFSCGMNSFYPTTIEYIKGFVIKREENIKKEFQKEGSCKYQTNEGCAIEKLRSPICNSWICGEYKDFLLNKFNIDYSGQKSTDEISSILLNLIYRKHINLEKIEKMIFKIEKATKRIESPKNNKKYSRIII